MKEVSCYNGSKFLDKYRRYKQSRAKRKVKSEYEYVLLRAAVLFRVIVMQVFSMYSMEPTIRPVFTSDIWYLD